MRPRTIRPVAAVIDAQLRAVPSKSATHRALVAAAGAEGVSRVRQPLIADDTVATRDGLRALGVEIEPSGDAWEVRGRPDALPGGARIALGESGTTFRFLTAVAALGEQPSTLDGHPRLAERPIAELAEALGSLGASVELPTPPASLPLRVGGCPPRGGATTLAASRSSQFASALLLVGARLPLGLELTLRPPAVSLPYVRLTCDVLAAFGVRVARPGDLQYGVSPTRYRGASYTVEGDHSSASYLLAAPALVGGRVRVTGLNPDSSQPDARLAGLLERMGCRTRTGEDWIEVEGEGRVDPFDLDMGEAPDLAPTVAVLALAADGPCVLRGIAHLRLKESDRLAMLAANLSALGRPARAVDDRLEIDAPRAGRARAVAARVRTASDHRMAMAFALAGLRLGGVTVDDADCVAKSNPVFWEQLEALVGR